MPIAYRTHPTPSCTVPYEAVEVPTAPDSVPIPPAYRHKILIDTIHDGACIPEAYQVGAAGRPVDTPEALHRRYVHERDWGANLVAHFLAAYLGTGRYHRVNIARVLLDFNRFPGSTPPAAADHLSRLAINPPFTEALGHAQKMALLEDVYDDISRRLEPVLADKLLYLGIHTYDEHNPSRTRRPVVSLITQPSSYQLYARMPVGVFDPLYPDELGDSTCSRTLRDRISLNLEREGFHVGHNHPYSLPEGSITVRSQVWFFFRYLRERFEELHPSSREDPAFEAVWCMLLDTNLRDHRAEVARSYLHRYRTLPPGYTVAGEDLRRAYEAIAAYCHGSRVVSEYRRWCDRPSSIVIEVRKDVVSRVSKRGELQVELFAEPARAIARTIAGAIATYLTTDRKE